MAALVNTFAIAGIEGYRVEAETTLLDGQPVLSIIGLGDQAVKESGDRIQAALDACGYDFPKKKVIINLAPGDRKKSGSHFDLAMALGVLVQSGSVSPGKMSEFGFIGELSLNGELRPCAGILPMVMAAKKCGIRKIVLPVENEDEAKLVRDVEVYGLSSMTQVLDLLEGRMISCRDMHVRYSGTDEAKADSLTDFADVRGQDDLIDAVVLAAAGGHNLLMIGTPGCGKTMVAQRIPSIMPEMTDEERLEVTKIHSIAGMVEKDHSLITERPFRAPHHNASLNALVGGGVNAMPGEVSLAHNGVLFLDELTEYSRHTLDALRQPIEDKKVTISRVNGTNTYPANFMLVAAMNPCPCGYYPDRKCRCTDYEIIKYRGRISGPVMDRIDIQKEVHAVGYFDMEGKSRSRTSAELREQVCKAREIQHARYLSLPGIYCNAQMTNSLIQTYCRLDGETTRLLKNTCDRYGYSARTIHKLLKLARTSADLNASENIRYEDVETAIRCRDLDRSNGEMMVVK
jgi:magnesium chelatase family protein